MFNIIFENDVLAVKKLIEERRYDENDITEKVKEIIKSGSNNIRIPYLPQTKNLLQKLDEIIYERGQERWEEKL